MEVHMDTIGNSEANTWINVGRYRMTVLVSVSPTKGPLKMNKQR